MTLDEAIDAFREAHPEWSTPEGAKNKCYVATVAFLDFLLERGVISPRTGAVGFRDWENYEDGVVMGTLHRSARVGTRLIDWTARQFWPSADFPRIDTILPRQHR